MHFYIMVMNKQDYPFIRTKYALGERIEIMQDEALGIPYLTFPLLNRIPYIKHLFSTRMGGVSEGYYASMNLGLYNGDQKELVLQNYERMAYVFGKELSDMVLSKQTHTTNLKYVTKKDCGKGLITDMDYDNIDGIYTDVPGIILATSYADCVPIYLVDTKERIIGLAHAGWKGTFGCISARMIEAMHKQFGCNPQNIIAAIGPSICQECYEVSSDVAALFQDLISTRHLEEFISEFYQNSHAFPYQNAVAKGKAEDKYQLDLWAVNYAILRCSGILPQNIAMTDICTCHNPDLLFSHRASCGKRGNLNAMMMLL